jgi:hypothetical protein
MFPAGAYTVLTVYSVLGCESRTWASDCLRYVRTVPLLDLGSRSHPEELWFAWVRLLSVSFVPVIGRQRHSPNVSRFIEFDSAMQRVFRIDINDASCSTLVRYVDVNRDSHSGAQPNCTCDQCSLKIDDDGLALTRPSLSTTLNRDPHLKRDTSASSGFVKRRYGRHERKDNPNCGHNTGACMPSRTPSRLFLLIASLSKRKPLPPPAPASGARSVVGRPARTTSGLAPAATSGIRSTQEECVPPVFTSGLQHSVSRVPGGRRISIGIRIKRAPNWCGIGSK